MTNPTKRWGDLPNILRDLPVGYAKGEYVDDAALCEAIDRFNKPFECSDAFAPYAQPLTFLDEEPVESSSAFRARMIRDCARPIAIVEPPPFEWSQHRTAWMAGCTSGPALIRPHALRPEDV